MLKIQPTIVGAMARYRVGLETRRRILDATREALAEDGLNDLTLKAITERADVGGVSYPVYPASGEPVIFIYDGYSGGVLIIALKANAGA